MFKNSVQKYNLKEIAPYIFIFLIGFLVFVKPFESGDEIWNYNFARNILQGNIPYRDFSIVQTPLSCYISAAFMYFLGDGLLIFRLVTYLLFVSIAALLFHLIRNVTKNVGVAFFSTLLVISAHFISFIYNYNYLTVLVLLIIFELEYEEMHREKKSFTINLIIGSMVGIIILIKQNTGAIIFLANCIICMRHYVKKPDSKSVYIVRVLCSFFPFIVYIIYLLLNGALNDFFEYAISGIATFTHRFSLLDFCSQATFFVPYLVLVIVFYTMVGVKISKGKVNDYQFSVLMFSLAWSSVIYPLADASHVILLLFTAVPTFLAYYSLGNLKWKEIPVAIILCYFTLFFMITISRPIDAKFNISKLENYQGVIIDERIEAAITTVDDYITKKQQEGYKVRIADVSSAAYKIPLNEYEKNWDMLLVGNLGLNNVNDLLKTEQPTLYLVWKDDSNYGMQDHYELIDYIKNNYKCIDQIAGFNVYAS